MSAAIILTELKETTLYVGLNRPAKRNALNDATIGVLAGVFDNLPGEAKCVVIHGIGDHFSAGMDLSELQERDLVEGMQHSRMWHAAMDKIQYAPIPVIAVLKGACVGGGLELASAAHIRVAETSTFYALPEGSRGIFLGGGGTVRLTRLIGTSRITDMMLTGRVYTAQEGHPIGFAQYLEADDKGLEKATELAARIAENAPLTNLGLTTVLPRISDAGHDAGLVMESLIAAMAQSAPEAKKRLRDFLEGRAKKVGE